jgi:hypothetical protein
LRGPPFVENLQAWPPQELIPDFFQEYASARGWLEGRPVYVDHHNTVTHYLGGMPHERRTQVVVSAHPPVSVLLALPLVRLGFPQAFPGWNLV